MTVAAARDPARIGVGRAPPLVSGAAIRLPPERATVFFAGAPPSRQASPRRRARRSDAFPTRPAVFRVGAEDAATVAIAAVGRLGMPDLSFDGRWLLAPVQATDGRFVCCRRRVDGRPAPAPRAGRRDRAAGPGERCRPRTRRSPQLRIQP